MYHAADIKDDGAPGRADGCAEGTGARVVEVSDMIDRAAASAGNAGPEALGTRESRCGI